MYCSPAKSTDFSDTCDFFPGQHVIPKRDYHGRNLFQIYSVRSAIDDLRPPLSEELFVERKKSLLFFKPSHFSV